MKQSMGTMVQRVSLGVTTRVENGSSWILSCYYGVMTVLAESPLVGIKPRPSPPSPRPRPDPVEMPQSLRRDSDLYKVVWRTRPLEEK